jgi:tetratricopeptide (TPR) repeat protein
MRRTAWHVTAVGTAAALLGGLACDREESLPKVPPVSTDAEHDLAYDEGVALIEPYIILHGQRRTSSPDWSRRGENVRLGIVYLTEVVHYNPDNWSAYFTMGKGWQALHEHERALVSFRESYAIEQWNPDVAREYVLECLELGHAEEAIGAAEHAVRLDPSDPGLEANLALAYCIGGRHDDAVQAVNRAREHDPADPITQHVWNVVLAVSKGHRPQPRTIGDLES